MDVAERLDSPENDVKLEKLSQHDSEPESDKEFEPKRVFLQAQENGIDGKMDMEQILGLWREQERYVDHLESKLAKMDSKDDKNDATRREHLLVCRLAMKEQELQELSNQIAELKAAQVPPLSSLKNALLDPAVNILIQNLKKELEASKKKMQETQEELSAWKFTPDSVTGKRLMAKCRQLLQENEDLGKMISSGRLAKLEGELAMQKALCEEMKKNQVEMDDFVQELDEDVEGMQSTIYFLQQQLKEAKDTIASMEAAKKDSSNDNDGPSESKKAKLEEESVNETPEESEITASA